MREILPAGDIWSVVTESPKFNNTAASLILSRLGKSFTCKQTNLIKGWFSLARGVGVGIAYDLVKIKNRSRKRSHKRDGIGVRRIRTCPFLPTPLTTPSLTFRLWSSENQIVGVGSRSGRINQWQCTFPCFAIGLVLLPLLLTPIIWFSQAEHKWRSCKWNRNTVFTRSEALRFWLITTPTPTPSLVKTSL